MRPVVTLNTDAFDALMTKQGCTTHSAIADALGLNPATVSRVRRGIHHPGQTFIAATLTAIPNATFHDLFTIK